MEKITPNDIFKSNVVWELNVSAVLWTKLKLDLKLEWEDAMAMFTTTAAMEMKQAESCASSAEMLNKLNKNPTLIKCCG